MTRDTYPIRGCYYKSRSNGGRLCNDFVTFDTVNVRDWVTTLVQLMNRVSVGHREIRAERVFLVHLIERSCIARARPKMLWLGCPESGTRNCYIFTSRCNSHVKLSISTLPKAPMKVQEDSKAMVNSLNTVFDCRKQNKFSRYTVSGTRNRYIFSPRCNSHVKTSISTPPKTSMKV